MNTKDKINFIKNHITGNENNIYKIIIKYDISYTKNKNGIFINLSKIDNNTIDKIYDNIKNNVNNIDNERYIEIKKYENLLSNKSDKLEKRKYIKFENLSDLDIEIIEYSKKI